MSELKNINGIQKKWVKSFFLYGFTITKKYVDLYLVNNPIKLGTLRDVTIPWNKKKCSAKINHVDIKNKKPVYQLRWDNNIELKTALKKEFIQSSIAIES